MKKSMKKNVALAALVAVSITGYAPSAHAGLFDNLTGAIGGFLETVNPEAAEKFDEAVQKVPSDFVAGFDQKAEEIQNKIEDASQELQNKDKEELKNDVMGKFEEALEQVVPDAEKREEILGSASNAFDKVYDQVVQTPGQGDAPSQDGTVVVPSTKEEVVQKAEDFFEKLAERWEAVDKKQLASDIKAGAEKVLDNVLGQLNVENKDEVKTQIKEGLVSLAGKLEGMTKEQAEAEFNKVVNNVVSKLEGVDQKIKDELKAGIEKVFADAKAQAQAAKDKVDAYHKEVAEDAVAEAKKEIEDKYNAQINRLDNRIDRLEDRVDKVGAMAAAMASLKTMGYDPAAPTEIAVGLGQYRDQTGIAVGAFHYPNRDFMLNFSVTTAGDEVMGGVGATWKIGRKK